MIRDTDPTQLIYSVRVCASRGRNPNNPTERKKCPDMVQILELGSGKYTSTITSVAKDNYLFIER